MEQWRLHNFWKLCTSMCAGQWKLHCMVEHDTFSLSLTISQGKLMSIFWRQKEKRLKNSNNKRHWWRTKLVTKSKCYVPTMEENLCLRNLMHFLRNVKFNDKQVRPIPHNKTVLRNMPIEPSWNVQEAWFLHNGWNLNFGAKRWTWRCTSKIDVQPRLLIPRLLKKCEVVGNPMCLIWEFLVVKPLHIIVMTFFILHIKIL